MADVDEDADLYSSLQFHVGQIASQYLSSANRAATSSATSSATSTSRAPFTQKLTPASLNTLTKLVHGYATELMPSELLSYASHSKSRSAVKSKAQPEVKPGDVTFLLRKQKAVLVAGQREQRDRDVPTHWKNGEGETMDVTDELFYGADGRVAERERERKEEERAKSLERTEGAEHKKRNKVTKVTKDREKGGEKKRKKKTTTTTTSRTKGKAGAKGRRKQGGSDDSSDGDSSDDDSSSSSSSSGEEEPARKGEKRARGGEVRGGFGGREEGRERGRFGDGGSSSSADSDSDGILLDLRENGGRGAGAALFDSSQTSFGKSPGWKKRDRVPSPPPPPPPPGGRTGPPPGGHDVIDISD